MRSSTRTCVTAAILTGTLQLGLAAALPAGAEEPNAGPPNPYLVLEWQRGPAKPEIGNLGTLVLPEGYQILGRDQTKRFIEMTQNIPDGDELAILVPSSEEETWFAIFSFADIGFVKDDDKDALDANAILESIKQGTEEGNAERRKRGWPEMHVVGWAVPPAYNATTKNLEWAVLGKASDSEEPSVNHSTRILGRHGVMNVALVSSTDQLDFAVTQMRQLLGGFTFQPGKRYAEFREGDKIAAVGLTGLIVGGAAVAAAKSGLLAKFFKPLLYALGALALGALKWIRGLFGRREVAE